MKSKMIMLLVLLAFLSGCAEINQLRMTDQIQMQKSEAKRGEYQLVYNLHITHYGADGRVKETRDYHNIVTSAGKAGVASRINGAGSEAVFNYIAIGTGTNAAVVGDTTLQTEIASGGGSRAVADTLARQTTAVTNDTAAWVKTFSFSSSFAVTESGIFNAASTGVLLARKVFAAINVVNGDALQVTWTVQVS